MTNLARLRKLTHQKLREIAAKVGTTPSTVHDAEVRGLRTPRAAMKYAVAFPGKSWLDLLDTPEPHLGSSSTRHMPSEVRPGTAPAPPGTAEKGHKDDQRRCRTSLGEFFA